MDKSIPIAQQLNAEIDEHEFNGLLSQQLELVPSCKIDVDLPALPKENVPASPPVPETVATITEKITGEPPRKKRPRHARRPLTMEELMLLVAHFEQVDHGFDPRWVLLMLLILQTGLRITDALSLTFGLFFRDGKFQGKFTVPACLNKGGHEHDYEREIHHKSVVYLQRIVDRAQAEQNYHANHPIFSGRHADEAACYATARRHLLEIFRAVFGTTTRLGAHSLRKAGARLVYKSKGLLAANAFLLHKSVDTTRIYLMLEDDEINAGVMEEFDEIYEVAKTQPVTPRDGKPAQLALPGTEEEAAPRPPKMSWEVAPAEVDPDESYFAATRLREQKRRQSSAKRAKAGNAPSPR